mmetsp:Transcript_17538/g.30556  ORF Transcript_17538/g.30556 Transcript_17538/m.30556 type:complete len:84 (-) Transcript_17538:977-1228(-)
MSLISDCNLLHTKCSSDHFVLGEQAFPGRPRKAYAGILQDFLALEAAFVVMARASFWWLGVNHSCLTHVTGNRPVLVVNVRAR